MMESAAESWQPLHGNHAIDVMAAVVTFSDQLPELLFRKVLKVSEDIALKAGLNSRHLTHGAQVQFSFQQEKPQVSPVSAGMLFNSIAETAEVALAIGARNEQLQIEQLSIIYRTWNYVSWDWQRQRLRLLFGPVLDIVKETVSLSTVRFEYLDRFFFGGEAAHADPKALLRPDSPLIARQIFEAPDQWHSHTGAFLEAGDDRKLLRQVFIDAIDQPDSIQGGISKVRWVNILTAREERFTPTADFVPIIDLESILATLDAMHENLKHDLDMVIQEDISKRIYLWDEPK